MRSESKRAVKVSIISESTEESSCLWKRYSLYCMELDIPFIFEKYRLDIRALWEPSLWCLQSWPGGGAGHAARPGCNGPGHSEGASPLSCS